MKHYWRIVLPLLIILSLLAAGCGPKATPTVEPTAKAEPTKEEVKPTEPPKEEPTEAPPEKVTITIWLGGDDFLPIFTDNVITPFNEQSDTVIVEVVPQANLWDALRTGLPAGEGPDIIRTMGPTAAAQLARAGYLLPLDGYAEQFNWAETVLPWALAIGEVDGKLYSIPLEVETLVLYYNKTLFEANGWQPPQTIDELMALCEQIKAAGVTPFAHAVAEYKQASEWYIGEFMNHVAGPQKVYEALTGAGRWDDPALIESIEVLNTFQQNGWFMGGLDKYYTVTFAERDAMFAGGQAAMDIEGTWAVGGWLGLFGEAAGNPNEWDWVPVPSKTGEAIYDLGIGGSLSIKATTEYPDAAAEFLNYYFRPEVQAGLIGLGFNSAPVKLTAEALSGVDPRYAAIIEAMGEASFAGNYGYTSWTFWPPKSQTYLLEIEKVWSGDMTAAEYLQGLQQQFEEELAAGEVPAIPVR